MQGHTRGTVISFHAYKGGSGTTTTLANTAWLLASAGKRVLAIDSDLQAPSLHRFYRPFLTDPDLVSTQGLLDAAVACAEPAPPSRRLQSFAVSVDWDFPSRGELDLLPAGRLDAGYAARVSDFARQAFFATAAGVAFVHGWRDELRAEYDYILIDTSAGVRDGNALDTIALPDQLCLCHTYNRQAVAGCRLLAEAAIAQRGAEPLRVFPLAMRADPAEKQLLDEQRAAARSELAPFIAHIGSPEQQQQYWRDVEFPYVPFHAYGETLPVFLDRPGDAASLSTVNERLCRYLSDGRVTTFAYPPAETRQAAIEQYRSAP